MGCLGVGGCVDGLVIALTRRWVDGYVGRQTEMGREVGG